MEHTKQMFRLFASVEFFSSRSSANVSMMIPDIMFMKQTFTIRNTVTS